MLLPALSQASTEHFEAMDVFDLEYVSDPQVAPDGKTVIYVRRSFDVMNDSKVEEHDGGSYRQVDQAVARVSPGGIHQ